MTRTPDRPYPRWRLCTDEAERLVALGVIAPFLALIAARSPRGESAVAPAAVCAEGAHRDAHGRVACGEPRTPAAALSPREALVAGTPMDVNAATALDLAVVPGIGPRLAARIVADRAEKGAFPSVAALARVRGIGPKLLHALGPYVRVARTASAEGSAPPSPQPPLARTALPSSQPDQGGDPALRRVQDRSDGSDGARHTGRGLLDRTPTRGELSSR